MYKQSFLFNTNTSFVDPNTDFAGELSETFELPELNNSALKMFIKELSGINEVFEKSKVEGENELSFWIDTVTSFSNSSVNTIPNDAPSYFASTFSPMVALLCSL